MLSPTFYHSRRSGFTLIELLVVLAIVAILAGLGFTGAQKAMEAARRTQASVMMGNIKIAISSYQSDYSRLPIPADSAGADYVLSTPEDWKDFTMMLIGNKDPITLDKIDEPRFPNPRENTYLEVQRKDLDSDGALKDPSFGKATGYFVIVLDGDYDGTVTVPADDATLNITEDTIVNSAVAIYTRAGGTSDKPVKAIYSW